MSASLAAQWLNQPTPGIPRTADGKPNLAAPAPRTSDGKPDLSGLWNKVSPKYSRNIAADLKPEDIQPWARALVEQRREELGRQYRLEIETLQSPKRIEAFATKRLHLVAPSQEEAIVIERVPAADPPGRSVVALR